MQVLPCPPSKNSSLVISALGLSLFITPPSHFDHEPWATLDFSTSLNEFRQSCAIGTRHCDTSFPYWGSVGLRRRKSYPQYTIFQSFYIEPLSPDFRTYSRPVDNRHIRRNSGGENFTRIFREETFQPCQYMFIYFAGYHLI